MSVTERLMRPGSFEVNLVDNAPAKAWTAVQEFDHIVITPTRLDNPANYTDARILAQASYTGVVTGLPTATSIEGEGLAYWLGTSDGRGAIYETAVSVSAATLSTTIAALLPSSITSGTITNTGTTLSYAFQFVTPREAIHFACAVMGAEWRINPSGTLDAASINNLFVTNPTVVITRKPEGREGSYLGIEATRLVVAKDVEGYSTKVVVIGRQGDGAEIATASATGANVYKDFNNNNVSFKRLIDGPDVPSTNLSTYATNMLAQYPAPRRHLRLTSKTYSVPNRVKAGDYVYVYDQQAGLVDTSAQIVWRGELLTPVRLRCKSITWPIQYGMGVYARRSGATPTYTDLTDWVRWEDEETSWEVGSSSHDPDQDPTSLNPAFLGVNAAIRSRIIDPDWIAYTPTLTNVTGGVVTGAYRWRGKKLEVRAQITAGTATAAGVITISLPGAATSVSVSQPIPAILTTGALAAQVLTSATTITVYGAITGGNFGLGAALANLRVTGLIHVN